MGKLVVENLLGERTKSFGDQAHGTQSRDVQGVPVQFVNKSFRLYQVGILRFVWPFAAVRAKVAENEQINSSERLSRVVEPAGRPNSIMKARRKRGAVGWV